MNKKAITPVLATVLLIVIAVALFVIIFFWMRGFQEEAIIKQGTAVENICPRIRFDVQTTGSGMQITNTGNIAIQEFKIIDGDGEATTLRQADPLMPGDTWSTSCSRRTKVIPVLRGQTSEGYQDYACEDEAITRSC
ncbi:MAG: hypothetical protein JSW08_02205 [archaeon]|nr:MAG: hypothetical protein JSW08_02205 [archaeon]